MPKGVAIRTMRVAQIGSYQILEELGKGSFSTVYRALNSKTREVVAIKVLDLKHVENEERLHKEIRILQALDHPNIVLLRDVIRDEEHLYLVMEYLEGGELFDYIIGHSRLSEARARIIFRDLLSALEYCHGNLVVHRGRPRHNTQISSQKTSY
jgi:serine/threonine protein kinase